MVSVKVNFCEKNRTKSPLNCSGWLFAPGNPSAIIPNKQVAIYPPYERKRQKNEDKRFLDYCMESHTVCDELLIVFTYKSIAAASASWQRRACNISRQRGAARE